MENKQEAKQRVANEINRVRLALDELEGRINNELDDEYSRVEGKLNEKINYLDMLQERTRDIENI
jgi:hypothetical protein